ncbi:unnamed protein product [Dovyalis caffra]|uniref:Uncharacterized protein n=1 Tax=Dovyalis caffra TaxID=77055 RepID=A0AAV1R367_9ROSI|nr:unnamed protein product [Dovyalis caffra]
MEGPETLKLAARASLLWAQNHVDQDREIHGLFCNYTGRLLLENIFLLRALVDNVTDDYPPPLVE